MKLNLKQGQNLTLPERLFALLNTELTKSAVSITTQNPLTFHFRDIDYSASNGGYHPVEIRVEKVTNKEEPDYWKVIYITDFSFQGAPYPELVKEIDICFTSNRVYSLFTGVLSHLKGQTLLTLFMNNFIDYYASEVYEVTITEL